MQRVLIGIFAAYAVTIAASPGGAQEAGASVSAPIRHDIDAQCDPLENPRPPKLQLFLRVHGAHVASARWRRNTQTPVSGGHASQEESFEAGTYAQAFVQRGRVRAAWISEINASSDVPVSSAYCYVADRLIRMRIEKAVPGSDTLRLIRTKYYVDGRLYTHSERVLEYGGDVNKSVRVPDTEPVYARPAALPFYALIAKAHA